MRYSLHGKRTLLRWHLRLGAVHRRERRTGRALPHMNHGGKRVNGNGWKILKQCRKILKQCRKILKQCRKILKQCRKILKQPGDNTKAKSATTAHRRRTVLRKRDHGETGNEGQKKSPEEPHLYGIGPGPDLPRPLHKP